MLATFFAVGNLHLYLSLALASSQMAAGNYHMGEQPGSAFSRHLLAWQCLVVAGCWETLFDWCRFDRSYVKTTVLMHNVWWLCCLGLRCRCPSGFKHTVLTGSATTRAAAHSESFCNQHAELAWRHRDQTYSYDVGRHSRWSADTGDSNTMPSASSALKTHGWAVALSESLTWRTILQYKFHRPGHINILEALARRAFVKRAPRDSRLSVGHDSRVLLGAGAKGRSPSRSLNRVFCSECPYTCGKNLHLASFHVPTWSIRADDPSRFKPPRGPRLYPPPWLRRLWVGDRYGEEGMHQLAHASKALIRWLLLGGMVLAGALASCRRASGARPPAPQVPGAEVGVDPQGPCRAADSSTPADPLGEFVQVAVGAGRQIVADLGPGGRAGAERFAGAVRSALVRAGGNAEHLRRNNQCSGAKQSLAPQSAGWAVESVDHMGALGATGSTPAPARTRSLDLDCYSRQLGVVELGGNFLGHVLRLAEAYRGYVSLSRGLLHQRHAEWHAARHLHGGPHPAPKDPQARGTAPIREDRRARSRRFLQEIRQDLVPESEALERISVDVQAAFCGHLASSQDS